MKQRVLCILLVGIGVFTNAYANTLGIQDSVLRHVESNLPDLSKGNAPYFTVLTQGISPVISNQPTDSNKTFYIKHVEIDNSLQQLDFLQDMVKDRGDRKYGVHEINSLLEELNAKLIDKGFVTSKVYIEPQQLATGILRLSLVVGRVEAVEFTGTAGNYSNALAFHTGDILNIRSIEQTIDNLNSVLHQKATVMLKPGSQVGSTVVVFHIENKARFEINTSIDNFGNEGTGKWQANVNLLVARPLNRTDSFYYSVTKAIPSDDTKGSRSMYLSYQIPVGNDSFIYSHSYADYEQTIAYAIHPFISSGHFTTDEWVWKHVLHRNSHTKTEMIHKIIHKKRHSFINGNEIDVQKRRTTAWEFDIHQTRYVRDGIVDWKLGYIRGLGMWADPGPTDALGGATTHYNLYVASASYTKQFALNEKYKATYRLESKGQYTTSRLYASEFFNLGGWYGVRGFSGDMNLAAEHGFYIRNTLEIPTSKVNSMYIGLDYGKVFGEYTSELLGQELAGGVIGVKGQWHNISYNVFGAYPLSKPKGFTVPSQLLGLQVNLTW